MERYTMFMDWKTQHRTSPQTDVQIQHISTIILASIFIDVNKIIWKCIWKGKESTIAKTILKKDKGIINLLDFNNYYIATVIKFIGVHAHTHTEQWNRRESL